jgi:hypothetical protein
LKNIANPHVLSRLDPRFAASRSRAAKLRESNVEPPNLSEIIRQPPAPFQLLRPHNAPTALSLAVPAARPKLVPTAVAANKVALPKTAPPNNPSNAATVAKNLERTNEFTSNPIQFQNQSEPGRGGALPNVDAFSSRRA